MHLIAFLSEREGVNPGSATYVADYCGRRRQIAAEDVLGPQTFHVTRFALKPLLLLCLGVMLLDFDIEAGYRQWVVMVGHKSLEFTTKPNMKSDAA